MKNLILLEKDYSLVNGKLLSKTLYYKNALNELLENVNYYKSKSTYYYVEQAESKAFVYTRKGNKLFTSFELLQEETL